MNTLIYLCGAYAMGFAIFHLFFWRLFSWKEELKKLSKVNRAIMQILNIRLIYFFCLVAFICFSYPTELTTTPLGRTFLVGSSLFCLGRTVEQFIFLRINNLLTHLLTALFVVGTILFVLPVLA